MILPLLHRVGEVMEGRERPNNGLNNTERNGSTVGILNGATNGSLGNLAHGGLNGYSNSHFDNSDAFSSQRYLFNSQSSKQSSFSLFFVNIWLFCNIDLFISVFMDSNDQLLMIYVQLPLYFSSHQVSLLYLSFWPDGKIIFCLFMVIGVNWENR